MTSEGRIATRYARDKPSSTHAVCAAAPRACSPLPHTGCSQGSLHSPPTLLSASSSALLILTRSHRAAEPLSKGCAGTPRSAFEVTKQKTPAAKENLMKELSGSPWHSQRKETVTPNLCVINRVLFFAALTELQTWQAVCSERTLRCYKKAGRHSQRIQSWSAFPSPTARCSLYQPLYHVN